MDFLFFFLTITTITIHDIMPMITTAMTIPVIVGSEVELEDDDDPAVEDDCITKRIKCHQLNVDGQMVCMKIHGVIISYIIIRIIYTQLLH